VMYVGAMSTQVLHEAFVDIAPTYITDEESQMQPSTRLQCGIAKDIKSNRSYAVLNNQYSASKQHFVSDHNIIRLQAWVLNLAPPRKATSSPNT
jgi:hypothetical protein